MFEWSASSEEMHVTPVLMFTIILGTVCEALYVAVSVCDYTAPVEGLSEVVVHPTLAGVCFKWQVMRRH